jgi:threonylcarbamoyladenosine tRNA methylthiotransferase MtaB
LEFDSSFEFRHSNFRKIANRHYTRQLMRTFFIQTLGCKVNHYESEQLATVLRSHGLVETDAASADLRIINSCSVTVDAASKSRQATRRAIRLGVLQPNSGPADTSSDSTFLEREASLSAGRSRSRTIVAGCWATGDKKEVEKIAGVDAVLTHHMDVAQRLEELLQIWKEEEPQPVCSTGQDVAQFACESRAGTHGLPLLERRQARHQRAFLKIQDGCDAHCTYCIIPALRPTLWSKPPENVVEEARRLVDAGHIELILTGIFLGAYGQRTALRRRQEPGGPRPLAKLIEMLCNQVPGLGRLRLSSLEPGDLDDALLETLRSHPQVVPHFHLPLQSGSTHLLRRMNRQYTQADFLRMIDRVQTAFDRPALTTDIIVGFPGETDEEFGRTMEVVEHSQFIHIHAFPFSPRPGTAAARWDKDFVRGPIVGERMNQLARTARKHSHAFRGTFVNQMVELLVERGDAYRSDENHGTKIRHGRCERYFGVEFESESASTGDLVKVRVDRVMEDRTIGTLIS